MEIKLLSGALGAEIKGIDLTDVSNENFKKVKDLLLEHKVIFFREQQLTKAQTVALLNGDDLKMSSRDKEIINIVTKSLRNSNYKPAKSGDVYVSTTITKKLNIPSYFCS